MIKPPLNWLEIEKLAHLLSPKLEGSFVERVIIPDRAFFPEGFIKGEWALRLSERKAESIFIFSLKPNQTYFAYLRDKGARSASKSTQSAFGLSISKYLKGAKLVRVEAIHRDRTLMLWFTSSLGTTKYLGLALLLIPASPEAFLIESNSLEVSAQAKWKILARSRNVKQSAESLEYFSLSDTSRAPENPPVRAELIRQEDSVFRWVESELERDAFTLRTKESKKALALRLKQLEDRAKQSRVALKEAQKETNYQKYGDLLKASFHLNPAIQGKNRVVQDFETGLDIEIPADPKLSLPEQVNRFYAHARRKQRRIEEAQVRLAGFEEGISKIKNLEVLLTEAKDWRALEKVETVLGLRTSAEESDKDRKLERKKVKKYGAWLGRTFTSKDGALIWVGRSRDENLELTFKHAKGNDIWLHVRGKPGAHVLLPLSSGKTASLDTLLDAARLCIFYSGGEKWGKTEVDYTFKKYVKRIKDSTEASYTHNKTLIVEPDPKRLKTLLDQAGS